MSSNYRQQAFNAKFKSASEYLGVDIDQVISLKLRDMVSSYDQYQEMLHIIEQEAGIHSKGIDGDFQGRGYLMGHEDQKIIVVEHETGLEVLYVAGSIASLLGLIPLVLQAWGGIRGYLDRRHSRQFRGVEIRRLDPNGNLIEDHAHGLAGPSDLPLSVLNTTLFSAARIIDADLRALRAEVKTLSHRLSEIEKNMNQEE